MAASATFALKAGVWFRRGRLLMVSPDSRCTACPLSGRNSTYRPVQIFEAGSYPTRATAEAVRGPNGTVLESFGKVWLYTIAEEKWHPSSGERLAVLGPFPITTGKQYVARYMEAVFTPGM